MTKHFHFEVGDPVRIVCQGLDVSGKVHSSYNDFDNMLAGVEMFTHGDTGYHYWKRGDGGRVYRKVCDDWLMVWPEFVPDPETKRVHPHFKVFLTDETDMWSDDIVSRLPEGCKLMGAYLVDVSMEIHICSTEPVYEAWWLYTVFGGDFEGDIPEDVLSEIAEEDYFQEPVTYFSTKVEWVHDYGKQSDCAWIINGTTTSDSRREWAAIVDFDSYDDLVEHMLEEARANHPV